MLWSQERRTSFKVRYTIDNVELNSPLSDVNRLSIINVISHISHSSILKSIRSNKTAKENSSQDAPRTDEEAVHSRQTAGN